MVTSPASADAAFQQQQQQQQQQRAPFAPSVPFAPSALPQPLRTAPLHGLQSATVLANVTLATKIVSGTG